MKPYEVVGGNPSPEANQSRPTRVGYAMVLLATLVAVLLYLDRICISTAAESVAKDLNITKTQLDGVLSAFFFTYALGQLPAGWLGDRFGARWMLGGYIVAWSVSTGLMGLAGSLQAVLILRLATGLFEAGAYPVAASIVRRWMPAERRGIASSTVAVGGRLGGALAPIITMQLMLFWSYGSGYWNIASSDAPSVTSWRPVMVVYGVVGVVIALIFMGLFRDSPKDHPLVNDAERKKIEGDTSHQQGESFGDNKKGSGLPFLAMLLSIPLWLNCFVQFVSNFGWVFLVTKMPQYLSQTFDTSPQSQSWFQSLPLAAGIPGLLLGGLFTDYLIRRFGYRWGRSVAMALSRTIVAVAFACSMAAGNALMATVCFVCMSFATDLGTPACWAFSQDVGGKHVGSVLGWANMWGNFGAALSPIFFGKILGAFESTTVGWQVVFAVCCGLNILAAFASLGISSKTSFKSDA